MSKYISSNHPYHNKKASIATIHQKDLAIGPILKRYIGLDVVSADSFNTDLLGTFTGETERNEDMLETARTKARQAILISNSDIGIGSEGSFGPHPFLPFAASGFELLLLINKSDGNEIFVSHRFNTNYNSITAHNHDDIADFLKITGFPEHALIVKPEKSSDKNMVVKGINDLALLNNAIEFLSKYSETGRVIIQTDMRAHQNPTRMKTLSYLAKKLAIRLSRLCPECHEPGFGMSDVERGLPCEECLLPTQRIIAQIYSCRLCGFKQKRHQRNTSARASSVWCQLCNP